MKIEGWMDVQCMTRNRKEKEGRNFIHSHSVGNKMSGEKKMNKKN